MSFAALLPGLGSIMGGLGGLFGNKKPQQPDIADNLRDQAWGARQAAEKFNFNPLTMLQMGQPAGAGLAAGGTPPLASIDLITGGLTDINDQLSGDAERRRQADILELDMAKLKYDQARAGVQAVSMAPRPVASGVGVGPSPLGRRSVVAPSPGGADFKSGRLTMATGPASSGGALTRSAPPIPSPRVRGNEMIPVTYPDGKLVQIPRGAADRLGIKPGGTLLAGDLEELKGEFVGGAESTVRAVDINRHMMTGVPVDAGRGPAEPADAPVLTYTPSGVSAPPPYSFNDAKSWWLFPN